MYTRSFECFVTLYRRAGEFPCYCCRTFLLDRRSLRSVLKRFCVLHSVECGSITSGDITWRYVDGSFIRG